MTQDLAHYLVTGLRWSLRTRCPITGDRTPHIEIDNPGHLSGERRLIHTAPLRHTMLVSILQAHPIAYVRCDAPNDDGISEAWLITKGLDK